MFDATQFCSAYVQSMNPSVNGAKHDSVNSVYNESIGTRQSSALEARMTVASQKF